MNKEIAFAYWISTYYKTYRNALDCWYSSDDKETTYTTKELWDIYIKTEEYKYYEKLKRGTKIAWILAIGFVLMSALALILVDQNEQLKTVVNDYHYNFQQQRLNEWNNNH